MESGDAVDWVVNYSLFSWAILCKILEIADVAKPNTRASCANDFSKFFINRSAISVGLGDLSDCLKISILLLFFPYLVIKWTLQKKGKTSDPKKEG